MKQFTARYGVRANTIRRWTNTYAEYFSDDANPPKGKRRRYTIEDADVIDLIADMRARDSEIGTILNALESGQRGSWPRDDYQAAEDDTEKQQQRMVLQSPEIAQMTIKIANLEGQLSAANSLTDKLLDQINNINERYIETQTQLRLLQQGEAAPTPSSDDTEVTDETPAADATPEKRRAWWRFWD